jgi:WD40 repeat protein
MAFPSIQEGFIQTTDISAQRTKVSSSSIFKAHSHSIACIVFGSTGKLIATASTHGTLIRVFDLQGIKLHEFRRSLTSTATILSLAFSLQNNTLAVMSSTGSLHVYFLDAQEQSSFPLWSSGPAKEVAFSISESKCAACAFCFPQALAPSSQLQLFIVSDDCTLRVFMIQGDTRTAKSDSDLFYRFYKSDNSLLSVFLKGDMMVEDVAVAASEQQDS